MSPIAPDIFILKKVPTTFAIFVFQLEILLLDGIKFNNVKLINYWCYSTISTEKFDPQFHGVFGRILAMVMDIKARKVFFSDFGPG
jgi:hypothetical protein